MGGGLWVSGGGRGDGSGSGHISPGGGNECRRDVAAHGRSKILYTYAFPLRRLRCMKATSSCSEALPAKSPMRPQHARTCTALLFVGDCQRGV